MRIHHSFTSRSTSWSYVHAFCGELLLPQLRRVWKHLTYVSRTVVDLAFSLMYMCF